MHRVQHGLFGAQAIEMMIAGHLYSCGMRATRSFDALAEPLAGIAFDARTSIDEHQANPAKVPSLKAILGESLTPTAWVQWPCDSVLHSDRPVPLASATKVLLLLGPYPR